MNRSRSASRIKKLWAVLPQQKKGEAVGLFALLTLVSLVEAFGVGTVLPFAAVAADPASLHKGGMLTRLYELSGAADERGFLLLCGLAVLIVIVVGNFLRGLSIWQTHHFSQMAGHILSTSLFNSYLSRPYEYFLMRHSSELAKNILQEANQVVNGVIFPGISALSRLLTAILVIALLIAADPLLTGITLISLGGAYGAIYALSRKLQSRLGRRQIIANQQRHYVASEVLSGIKEVKLKGLESRSTERFSNPSYAAARGLAISQTLAQTPRFLLEAVAFGGILIIMMHLLISRGGIAASLPLITLYAFAGYRLLPAMQEVFASATRMRFAWPSLELVGSEMRGSPQPTGQLGFLDPLPFTNAICLEGVCYRYPSGERPVIRDLDLVIPRGARVGFIGATGSGKSTVVDLILGLLRPTQGRILIDGLALEDEAIIARWQRQIGYVPQHIFLADDTIAANIAFGEHPDSADLKLIERAAKLAQLHTFIVNDLPKGYDTLIGESGVRLSGGQRQRLGLARALYGDPAVLVLDEATSALDHDTEMAVMEALGSLDQRCTIIAIAHRLSTLSRSDLIVRLGDGGLMEVGPPETVLSRKNVGGDWDKMTASID